MSANNSLSETNGASEPNLASELALRVALQTIKERCVSLHQRLAIVEEENLTIKSKLSGDNELRADDSETAATTTESEMLRERLAKVTKEKLQLGEHIAMVTTENRQLWSRLSQLVKDHNNKQKKTDDGGEQAVQQSSGNVQRLIRSETFTQHSPNVLLRPKPIVATAAAGAVPAAATIASSNRKNEGSMEDVSLKQLGGYMVDDKYVGGTSDKTGGDNDKTLSTLNFGYLNDEASRAGDFTQDLNNCASGMYEMRMEMERQQAKLKVLVDLLKERRANPQCLQCRKHREKPETADKGSETDGSLSETTTSGNEKPSSSPSSQLRPRPAPPLPPDPSSYDSSSISTTTTTTTAAHINILEQKRLADDRDKMCPLCGKIYSSAVSFNEFLEHVETHFIDDIELDPNSAENNFEFISHTVGNF